MKKLKERKKTCMNFSLSVDMTEKLRAIPERTGIRLNFIVEKALEEYLAKYNLLDIRDSPPDTVGHNSEVGA